jgi:modulator of FtsH protease HflC
VISRYRLDELVNLDRDRLKLAQIEDEAKQALEASLAESGYGLKVESVGLYKIVLPESTTEKIFETMIKTRERLCGERPAGGAGPGVGDPQRGPRAPATGSSHLPSGGRRRFDRRAIAKPRRNTRASPSNEDFAIFLRKVEALKKMLDHNTTFVLSADSLGILDWFNRDPGQTAPAGAALPGGQAAQNRAPKDRVTQ